MIVRVCLLCFGGVFLFVCFCYFKKEKMHWFFLAKVLEHKPQKRKVQHWLGFKNPELQLS